MPPKFYDLSSRTSVLDVGLCDIRTVKLPLNFCEVKRQIKAVAPPPQPIAFYGYSQQAVAVRKLFHIDVE